MTDAPDPRSAFIEAACVPLDGGHATGTLAQAEAILAAHPDVRRRDIHTAAILGDHEAVGRFIAREPGAATASAPPRGWDALTHLCFSRYLRLDRGRSAGFVRAAEALLDAGAVVESGRLNADSLATTLLRKVDWRDGAAVRWLLGRGADPNRILRWGRTALHQAVLRDNALATIEALLDHGAEPLRTIEGASAAALAARRGRGDVLAAMARRGAPRPPGCSIRRAIRR